MWRTSYRDSDGAKYAACVFGAKEFYAVVRMTEQPFSVTLLGLPIRSTIEEAWKDMSLYALFHGLEKTSQDTISFTETESEQDVCPVCLHPIKDYTDQKFEGSYYVSFWDCPHCNSSGRQMEKVEFTGHVVDVSDFGCHLQQHTS